MRSTSTLVLVALAAGSLAPASCTCGTPVGTKINGPNAPGGGEGEGEGEGPVNGDPLTTALASEVRRLTSAELDRTLETALLDGSAPGDRLLPRDTFTPFDNHYLDQESSAALIDGLEALSTEVAVRALTDAAARARLIPCTPASVDDQDCFDQVVRAAGLRLLRRPIEDAELVDYRDALEFARETSPYYATGFDTAIEVALRALLMDPELLFRIEVGTPTGETGVVRLNPYETATRMAFLLWGQGPDDALLADAATDALDAADTRGDIARRMLADERARAELRRFHAQWLGYRAIPHPADLANRFAMETGALLDRIVFEEDRDYLDVFRLEETYLDDALADHYGIARPTTSPGWVSLAGTSRAGILSQGAVLSSFAKVGDTSPTQRGILVRNRLMCQTIDPPPPDVMADQPPPATEDAVCKFDRYAEHRTNNSCNACHSTMDPIGFGLENYNMGGQFRAHDDGLPECLIDGNGELPGWGTFRGPKELAQKLVDNDLVGPCFLEQLTKRQIGREITADERAVLDAWRVRFDSSDRSVQALLVEQVAGEQFVTKREPAAGGGP